MAQETLHKIPRIANFICTRFTELQTLLVQVEFIYWKSKQSGKYGNDRCSNTYSWIIPI